MASSSTRPGVAIFLGLVILFALFGRQRLLNDADTLWHIVVGRHIVSTGMLTSDPFTFTRHGERWIANQWLAECALAVCDRLAGFDGVLWLTVAVLVTTYFGLARRLLLRGIDPVLTVALLSLVIAAGAYTLNARPHIATIALLAVTFVLARRYEDGNFSTGRLSVLIPIFAVWANLHGGVLGGLATLAMVITAWTGLWLMHRTSPIVGRRDALILWLVLGGCAAALFATPYVTGSLEAWLTILRLPLTELVIEHAPLDVASLEGLLALVLFLVYVAVFAGCRRYWGRPTFWLPIAWFALTVTRVRHAPLFAVMAGLALADLLPCCRWAGYLRRRGWLRASVTSLSEQPGYPYRLVLGTWAVLLSAVMIMHVVGASWARPGERVWPEPMLVPLAHFAETHPPGTRIFNEPILGGFLIYNFPSLQIFIDGRCELFGEHFLRDFVAAWRNPQQIAGWQEAYGFSAALVEKGSPLEAYFQQKDNWIATECSTTATFFRMEEE